MKKMNWYEMKKLYPNQWLLIVNFELNEFGQLTKGIVKRHSKEKKVVYKQPALDEHVAFRYTGESTFSGLRSHAKHNQI